MRTCPKCGNRYPVEFDACPVDGTKLPPAQKEDPYIGETLLGTYTVQRKLGEGGMAKVYIAVNERVGRQFAVKFLAQQLSTNEGLVERFFREARAAAGLNHPNIIQVLDCDRTPDGVPFMVLELLQGEDLGDLLMREEKLNVERARSIARQMADALAAAHSQGIVHRDVKPSNTFMVEGREGEQVKILDFGIARLAGESRLTREGEVVGTPLYMSPEQARGDEDVGTGSDIYSLGATLYHMLCGEPVFDGESGVSVMIQHITEEPPRPMKLRPDMGRQTEDLILKMLAKDPEARPKSAEAVMHALAPRSSTVADTMLRLSMTEITSEIQMEEVRVVTVLVADVDTTASRDIETQLREADAGFEVLSEEIERQGGRVEHLAGNRVVGLFGLTLTYGDEPARAVEAGLATLGRVPESTACRIAVGTGRTLARAGSISTGPASSAAARLLRRIKAGGLAVDAATYSRVRGTFQCTALPGAEGTDSAYEVKRRFDQGGHLAVPGIFGRQATTVGRDDELDHLTEILRRALKSGTPQVVQILGEGGLGKSRLRKDFILALDSMLTSPYQYLEGEARSLSREQPFHAIGDVLRRAARLEADCTEEQARQALGQMASRWTVEDDDDVLTELITYAAGKGTIASPALKALHDKPARLRARIIDAIEQLLAGASHESPLILCIDNGEHIDQPTVDALARVSTLGEGHPMVVMLCGRPAMARTVGESFPDTESHHTIKLQPLSRSETRQLVTQLMGNAPPRKLLDAILQRTEGVPLFVEEFLFTLRHQGVVVPDEESEDWVFVEKGDISVLPTTVEGMLQSRLDSFEPELKQSLRRAAVMGEVFWDDALAAMGQPDVRDSLSSLVRREVVVARPESSVGGCLEYAFRSVVLRDVTYQMIPGSERAQLHEQAADWLADRGASPAVLAWHLDMAGKATEAAQQYVLAAHHARDSYANDDALHQYERAQHLLTQGQQDEALLLPVLFGMEEILARVGARNDAMEVLDEAKAIAKRTDDRTSLARVAVRQGALSRLVDPRKALPMLERALSLCWNAGDTKSECMALRQLAQAQAFSGDLEKGAETASQAVVVARRLDQPRLLMRTLIDDGTIAVIRLGHFHGLAPFKEALDIARHVGDVEGEADILMRLGFLASELGDLDSARRDLEQARELLVQVGNSRVLAFTLHNLGWVLWKQEEAREARLCEEMALDIARDSHLDQVALATEVYLALFDLGEEHPDRALERAHEVRRTASEAGHVEPELFACMAEALAHLALGFSEKAMEAALRSVELYQELGGTQQFEVELHLVAARSMEAAGRSTEASSFASLAAEALERRTDPITDEDAIERLKDSIGMGLPASIR